MQLHIILFTSSSISAYTQWIIIFMVRISQCTCSYSQPPELCTLKHLKLEKWECEIGSQWSVIHRYGVGWRASPGQDQLTGRPCSYCGLLHHNSLLGIMKLDQLVQETCTCIISGLLLLCMKLALINLSGVQYNVHVVYAVQHVINTNGTPSMYMYIHTPYSILCTKFQWIRVIFSTYSIM